MTTDCTSDEFYKRMTLVGVEGQATREVEKLPLSNCNTYQEFDNFDDFKQEVSTKGKMVDKSQEFKFEDIANTFSDIIQKKQIIEDNNFKLTNEIILLVAREIKNSVKLIFITDANGSQDVLLDKQHGKDRFFGVEHKAQVSEILKDMLKDEIFSKIQDIQPEDMLNIVMAFFTLGLFNKQYGLIFGNDDDNEYNYNAGFAEISPDILGPTNFVYIQKNTAIISELFGVNPDTLGNSTYHIIIDPQGEIIIEKTMFYFLFGSFKGSQKILLAMIQNEITYFLKSNRKTIKDKFRWILCQSDYNFIKSQCGESEKPWFLDCLSIDKDLKPVTKVEETQYEIVLRKKRIAEMEELIAFTASVIEDNNSKFSPPQIEEQRTQNEKNKLKLQRMQNELETIEAQHTVNVETQNKIEGLNSEVAEMEALITKNESDIETNSSNLSQEQIEEKRQQNEVNKTRLSELQTQVSQLTQPEDELFPEPTINLVASDPSLAATTEEAKIGMGSRVWSTVKQNPIKTILGLGGLATAGTFLGMALTGGKDTKKPRRKLKKRVTQRKPKILTKNNTKKRKKIKKRRRVKTIKKR